MKYNRVGAGIATLTILNSVGGYSRALLRDLGECFFERVNTLLEPDGTPSRADDITYQRYGVPREFERAYDLRHGRTPDDKTAIVASACLWGGPFVLVAPFGFYERVALNRHRRGGQLTCVWSPRHRAEPMLPDDVPFASTAVMLAYCLANMARDIDPTLSLPHNFTDEADILKTARSLERTVDIG